MMAGEVRARSKKNGGESGEEERPDNRRRTGISIRADPMKPVGRLQAAKSKSPAPAKPAWDGTGSHSPSLKIPRAKSSTSSLVGHTKSIGIQAERSVKVRKIEPPATLSRARAPLPQTWCPAPTKSSILREEAAKAAKAAFQASKEKSPSPSKIRPRAAMSTISKGTQKIPPLTPTISKGTQNTLPLAPTISKGAQNNLTLTSTIFKSTQNTLPLTPTILKGTQDTLPLTLVAKTASPPKYQSHDEDYFFPLERWQNSLPSRRARTSLLESDFSSTAGYKQYLSRYDTSSHYLGGKDIDAEHCETLEEVPKAIGTVTCVREATKSVRFDTFLDDMPLVEYVQDVTQNMTKLKKSHPKMIKLVLAALRDLKSDSESSDGAEERIRSQNMKSTRTTLLAMAKDIITNANLSDNSITPQKKHALSSEMKTKPVLACDKIEAVEAPLKPESTKDALLTKLNPQAPAFRDIDNNLQNLRYARAVFSPEEAALNMGSQPTLNTGEPIWINTSQPPSDEVAPLNNFCLVPDIPMPKPIFQLPPGCIPLVPLAHLLQPPSMLPYPLPMLPELQIAAPDVPEYVSSPKPKFVAPVCPMIQPSEDEHGRVAKCLEPTWSTRILYNFQSRYPLTGTLASREEIPPVVPIATEGLMNEGQNRPIPRPSAKKQRASEIQQKLELRLLELKEKKAVEQREIEKKAVEQVNKFLAEKKIREQVAQPVIDENKPLSEKRSREAQEPVSNQLGHSSAMDKPLAIKVSEENRPIEHATKEVHQVPKFPESPKGTAVQRLTRLLAEKKQRDEARASAEKLRGPSRTSIGIPSRGSPVRGSPTRGSPTRWRSGVGSSVGESMSRIRTEKPLKNSPATKEHAEDLPPIHNSMPSPEWKKAWESMLKKIQPRTATPPPSEKEQKQTEPCPPRLEILTQEEWRNEQPRAKDSDTPEAESTSKRPRYIWEFLDINAGHCFNLVNSTETSRRVSKSTSENLSLSSRAPLSHDQEKSMQQLGKYLNFRYVSEVESATTDEISVDESSDETSAEACESVTKGKAKNPDEMTEGWALDFLQRSGEREPSSRSTSDSTWPIGLDQLRE